MSRADHRIAITFLALSGLAAPAGAAFETVNAVDNATIQATGPRTGGSGRAFLNFEGSNNNNFASFGVVDFTTTAPSPAASTISSIVLTLTESNAQFSAAGRLEFFVAADTTTLIDAGTSPLKYNASSLPTGLNGQLSPIFLGNGTYTKIATGTKDTFTFTPTGSAATTLLNEFNAGKIRLIVAPGDATVAATYAGFTNTNTATPGPSLTVNFGANGVPEPAGVVLMGMGALGMFGVVGRRLVRSNF